jgi:hypothetical protein
MEERRQSEGVLAGKGCRCWVATVGLKLMRARISTASINRDCVAVQIYSLDTLGILLFVGVKLSTTIHRTSVTSTTVLSSALLLSSSPLIVC